jgi:hypothetical protein
MRAYTAGAKLTVWEVRGLTLSRLAYMRQWLQVQDSKWNGAEGAWVENIKLRRKGKRRKYRVSENVAYVLHLCVLAFS